MLTQATNTQSRVEPALLRSWDVRARTGLSRTTMHRLMQSGDFPRPVVIAKRAVAWKATEVAAWLNRLSHREART
jgi:prophage regulatory protein